MPGCARARRCGGSEPREGNSKAVRYVCDETENLDGDPNDKMRPTPSNTNLQRYFRTPFIKATRTSYPVKFSEGTDDDLEFVYLILFKLTIHDVCCGISIE